MIEESLKYTLPHSERQKLVGVFLELFASRMTHMFAAVGQNGAHYVESRTTKNIEIDEGMSLIKEFDA